MVEFSGVEANRVEAVVRRTLSYAAGMTESQLTSATTMFELGIDSVTAAAFGVVLESELELRIPPAVFERIFQSETVGDAIGVVTDLVRDGGGE